MFFFFNLLELKVKYYQLLSIGKLCLQRVNSGSHICFHIRHLVLFYQHLCSNEPDTHCVAVVSPPEGDVSFKHTHTYSASSRADLWGLTHLICLYRKVKVKVRRTRASGGRKRAWCWVGRAEETRQRKETKRRRHWTHWCLCEAEVSSDALETKRQRWVRFCLVCFFYIYITSIRHIVSLFSHHASFYGRVLYFYTFYVVLLFIYFVSLFLFYSFCVSVLVILHLFLIIFVCVL